ncbi:hypothetical protein KPH14_012430 [Odynerus spinipes]|uniref:Uncharacterized protein n=1 Tax=Odynerus spinipes TaxID=1348599 RepID=A0AAD9VMR0_9HYME|nr:hypothetical protein KPH14_012430 [Odynerus spinipes]
MIIDCIPWSKCMSSSRSTPNILASLGSKNVMLLGFSPDLGQRVHFAEGTNLRCREDPKPSDETDERLANSKSH